MSRQFVDNLQALMLQFTIKIYFLELINKSIIILKFIPRTSFINYSRAFSAKVFSCQVF